MSKIKITSRDYDTNNTFYSRSQQSREDKNNRIAIQTSEITRYPNSEQLKMPFKMGPDDRSEPTVYLCGSLRFVDQDHCIMGFAVVL